MVPRRSSGERSALPAIPPAAQNEKRGGCISQPPRFKTFGRLRYLDDVDLGGQVRRHFEADFLLTNRGLGPGLHRYSPPGCDAGISHRLRMVVFYRSARTRSNRKFVRSRSDFLNATMGGAYRGLRHRSPADRREAETAHGNNLLATSAAAGASARLPSCRPPSRRHGSAPQAGPRARRPSP